MAEKLLGLQETLDRLQISRKTLYVLIKEGKIRPTEKPAYLKKRKKIEFTESEVERVLRGDPPEPNNKAA